MILLELLVKKKKLNEKNKMVKGFSKQTKKNLHQVCRKYVVSQSFISYFLFLKVTLTHYIQISCVNI